MAQNNGYCAGPFDNMVERRNHCGRPTKTRIVALLEGFMYRFAIALASALADVRFAVLASARHRPFPRKSGTNFDNDRLRGTDD
jgi:hypothetical protein